MDSSKVPVKVRERVEVAKALNEYDDRMFVFFFNSIPHIKFF